MVDSDIVTTSTKRLDLTDISDYNSTEDFCQLAKYLSYWSRYYGRGKMKKLKILVVDDEEDIRNILGDRLQMYGYEVVTAADGLEALEKVQEEEPDLVLLDIMMPHLDGLEVLDRIKRDHPEMLVMMITAFSNVERATEAILDLGAYDYIEKPFTPDLIRIKVDKALELRRLMMENEYLRSELKGNYVGIIGRSPNMMDVLGKIERIAPSNLSVLITGETGTGKELVAHALHNNSPRSSKPFAVLNCAAIQSTLVESELFGHEKGAFTGATTKPGKMELADGGTLFLDEIGDMAYELQAKLLRAIQEGEFERVGGIRNIKVDIRFIAATNRDLEKALEEEKFRSDLFYRLSTMVINIPPLREHREDIPLLVEHFLRNAAANNLYAQVSDEAMKLLMSYHWPGNIRELQHCIERGIWLTDSDTVQPGHLPPELSLNKVPKVDSDGITIGVGTTVKDAERALIIETVRETRTQDEAANMLKISVRKVQEKLKEYKGQGYDISRREPEN
jgi:two-component system, NtrC family, response regulator AtoC